MSLSIFLSLLRIAYEHGRKQALTAIRKLIKHAKIIFDNVSSAFQTAVQNVVDAFNDLTPGQKIAAKIVLGLVGVGVAIGLIIVAVKLLGPLSAANFFYWAWWAYNQYKQYSKQHSDDWAEGGSDGEWTSLESLLSERAEFD